MTMKSSLLCLALLLLPALMNGEQALFECWRTPTGLCNTHEPVSPSPWFQLRVAVLSLIPLLAFIFNLFIVVVVCVYRHLQVRRHILFASMAVNGLLLSVLCMPLALLDSVSRYWFLGERLCEVKRTFDLFLVTASVLHVLCLALDCYCRWRSSLTRHTGKVGIYILVIYLWSASVALPPLYFGKSKYDPDVDGICSMIQVFYITITCVIEAFWIPLFLLLLFCFGVCRHARRRRLSVGIASDITSRHQGALDWDVAGPSGLQGGKAGFRLEEFGEGITEEEETDEEWEQEAVEEESTEDEKPSEKTRSRKEGGGDFGLAKDDRSGVLVVGEAGKSQKEPGKNFNQSAKVKGRLPWRQARQTLEAEDSECLEHKSDTFSQASGSSSSQVHEEAQGNGRLLDPSQGTSASAEDNGTEALEPQVAVCLGSEGGKDGGQPVAVSSGGLSSDSTVQTAAVPSWSGAATSAKGEGAVREQTRSSSRSRTRARKTMGLREKLLKKNFKTKMVSNVAVGASGRPKSRNRGDFTPRGFSKRETSNMLRNLSRQEGTRTSADSATSSERPSLIPRLIRSGRSAAKREQPSFQPLPLGSATLDPAAPSSFALQNTNPGGNRPGCRKRVAWRIEEPCEGQEGFLGGQAERSESPRASPKAPKAAETVLVWGTRRGGTITLPQRRDGPSTGPTVAGSGGQRGGHSSQGRGPTLQPAQSPRAAGAEILRLDGNPDEDRDVSGGLGSLSSRVAGRPSPGKPDPQGTICKEGGGGGEGGTRKSPRTYSSTGSGSTHAAERPGVEDSRSTDAVPSQEPCHRPQDTGGEAAQGTDPSPGRGSSGSSSPDQEEGPTKYQWTRLDPLPSFFSENTEFFPSQVCVDMGDRAGGSLLEAAGDWVGFRGAWNDDAEGSSEPLSSGAQVDELAGEGGSNERYLEVKGTICVEEERSCEVISIVEEDGTGSDANITHGGKDPGADGSREEFSRRFSSFSATSEAGVELENAGDDCQPQCISRATANSGSDGHRETTHDHSLSGLLQRLRLLVASIRLPGFHSGPAETETKKKIQMTLLRRAESEHEEETAILQDVKFEEDDDDAYEEDDDDDGAEGSLGNDKENQFSLTEHITTHGSLRGVEARDADLVDGEECVVQELIEEKVGEATLTEIQEIHIPPSAVLDPSTRGSPALALGMGYSRFGERWRSVCPTRGVPPPSALSGGLPSSVAAVATRSTGSSRFKLPRHRRSPLPPSPLAGRVMSSTTQARLNLQCASPSDALPPSHGSRASSRHRAGGRASSQRKRGKERAQAARGAVQPLQNAWGERGHRGLPHAWVPRDSCVSQAGGASEVSPVEVLTPLGPECSTLGPLGSECSALGPPDLPEGVVKDGLPPLPVGEAARVGDALDIPSFIPEAALCQPLALSSGTRARPQGLVKPVDRSADHSDQTGGGGADRAHPENESDVTRRRPGQNSFTSRGDVISVRPSSGEHAASVQSQGRARKREGHVTFVVDRWGSSLGLVLFLALTFVLCWLPFFLALTLHAASPDSGLPLAAINWLTWLGYLSSVVIPVIYVMLNAAFSRLLSRWLCCKRRPEVRDRETLKEEVFAWNASMDRAATMGTLMEV